MLRTPINEARDLADIFDQGFFEVKSWSPKDDLPLLYCTQPCHISC